jgi:multiple sugar transport system substrate-binding protein
MTFHRFLSAFLLAATVFTLTGCGGPSEAELAAAKSVTLNVWRVFDDKDTMKPAMDAYQAIHPNVSFKYRTLRLDEYEEELVRAFAEGNGPDIFSIHNTWIGKYEDLILPLPTSLTIPYTEVRGTVKKETVVTLKEEPTLSMRALKSDFLDVIATDVVRSYQPNPKKEAEDRIFALPLSVDTLALYYNKDLFNGAGIAQPPTSWTAFQDTVQKLTTLGANDSVTQSGAALGTAENIERSFDILSVLMMQNGTAMTSERGIAAFGTPNADRALPGADAVRFYTDFANPLKAVYSWNKDQPSSFDAFTTGKTAMFLGYSYHLPLIRARAPKLNFGIAALPQISEGRTVNYANYWVETVSKSTKNSNWAWDFVQFAVKADRAKSYIEEAQKPPALRSLIESLNESEDLSVFAGQLLTAKSWYKGDDVDVAEEAFEELINDTLSGVETEEAMRAAQNKVNETL